MGRRTDCASRRLDRLVDVYVVIGRHCQLDQSHYAPVCVPIYDVVNVVKVYRFGFWCLNVTSRKFELLYYIITFVFSLYHRQFNCIIM